MRYVILMVTTVFMIAAGLQARADDAPVVSVSVSYEMLKGLPAEVKCLERIEQAFDQLLIRDEPWKRIVQSVRGGRSDLTPCVFKNKERETFLDLYGPIAKLPIVLVSKKQNAYELSDLSRLRGAFHRGTSLIKKFIKPGMHYQEVSEIDGLFNLIRKGRVDYSIVPGNFLSARDTDDLFVRVVDGTPLYIGVSKKSINRDYILKRLVQKVTVLPEETLQASGDLVVWAYTNFPPYFINAGRNSGQGISDQTTDFYIKRLPTYHHQKLQVSLPRALAMMKNGEPVCHGALLRTKEREEFIDFLEPNMAVFPNGVLVSDEGLQQVKPFMDDTGAINFEALVKADTLSLRFYGNRSYSPVIDDVLKRYEGKTARLYKLTGRKDMKRQLSLLLSGHVGAVIGRAEEAYYLRAELKLTDRVHFVPVQGDKPFQLGQIGCAKGNWNKTLIASINQISAEYRASETFAEFYQQWLPESSRDHYRAVQTRAFGSNQH